MRLNSLVRGEIAFVGASGYHSPASVHKDDNRLWLVKVTRGEQCAPEDTVPGGGPGRPGKSKLLNMRDFRA